MMFHVSESLHCDLQAQKEKQPGQHSLSVVVFFFCYLRISASSVRKFSSSHQNPHTKIRLFSELTCCFSSSGLSSIKWFICSPFLSLSSPLLLSLLSSLEGPAPLAGATLMLLVIASMIEASLPRYAGRANSRVCSLAMYSALTDSP